MSEVRKKGSRRKARETAVQVFYYIDHLGFSAEEAWTTTEEKIRAGVTVKDYAKKLFEGVSRKKTEIDSLIEKYSKSWALDRMPVLDRNILRLGIYEILFEEDMPPKVAINEALELAKTFSTDEARKFINGILDRVAKQKSG